jgi:hypothetical protein
MCTSLHLGGGGCGGGGRGGGGCGGLQSRKPGRERKPTGRSSCSAASAESWLPWSPTWGLAAGAAAEVAKGWVA